MIKQIVFCGCGGLYHYYIGIASVLQKIVNKNHNIIFGGISGGCIPSLFLVLGIDLDELYIKVNLPMLSEIGKHSLGALFNYNLYAKKWLLSHLPMEAYKQLEGRYRVSVTKVDGYFTTKNEIIESFTSNEDLVDCIICSAYIPFFDRSVYKQYRNGYYVDGCLSDWDGKNFVKDNVETFYIHRNKWRQMKTSWLWCYTDEKWADTLYNWGIYDAYAHLDELIEFLGNECHAIDSGIDLINDNCFTDDECIIRDSCGDDNSGINREDCLMQWKSYNNDNVARHDKIIIGSHRMNAMNVVNEKI